MPHIRFGNVSEIIMNDNDNMPAGAEGAPSPATPDAAPDNSRSAVFSAIRSIFGRNPDDQQPDAPVPAPETPPAPAFSRSSCSFSFCPFHLLLSDASLRSSHSVSR